MNPDWVANDETLGRGVFDGNVAGRTPPRANFFENELSYNQGHMSVDRMTYADSTVLCQVHDDDALRRGPNRTFYGWYTFPVALVRAIGLDVEPTQSTDPRNEWHAEVSVPDSDSDMNDAITAYANAISSEAAWEPKPLNPGAQRDIEQAGQK